MPDDGIVDAEFGCPQCGERHADSLVFAGDCDDEVRCLTCGMVYEPGK